MNEYPPVVGDNINSVLNFIRGISILRKEDVVADRNLKTRFIAGRLRTDRTTPTSNSDVNATDKEGDVVRTTTYQYIIVNDSGTLKWARHAIDITW
jgi:hypothetical protein